MKDYELQPGIFVYHRELGAGRIESIDGNGQLVVVNFSKNGPEPMPKAKALTSLKLLDSNGLEATLLTNPVAPHSWIKEAPLKLMAAVLKDQGGSAKSGEIRSIIEGLVLDDIKWDTWWKPVRSAVKESIFFRVTGATLKLIGDPSQIPQETLATLQEKEAKRRSTSKKSKAARPKPATTKEWVQWLVSNDDKPLPGNVPPRAFLELVGVLAPLTAEDSAERVLSALRLMVDKKRKLSPQVMRAWSEAIGAFVPSEKQKEPPVWLASFWTSLAEVTVHMLQTAHVAPAEALMPVLISAAQKSERIAVAVGEGLQRSLRGSPRGTSKLCRALWESLPENAWAAVGGKLAEGMFGQSETASKVPFPQDLDPGTRDKILECAVLAAAAGRVPKGKVVDLLVAEWKERGGTARLALWGPLMASVTLFVKDGDLAQRIVEESFAGVIQGSNTKIPEEFILTKLARLALDYVTEVRAESEGKRKQDVSVLEAKQVDMQAELVRKSRQVDDLHQELALRREESRLELRKDMLALVGETLQMLSENRPVSESLIADLEAALTLALYAGGAQAFGKKGEIVSYSQRLHDTKESLQEGAPAVITAPGVVVKSERLRDAVVLKAKVQGKGG